MPSSWTQSIRFAWRPELKFYDARTQILRDFDQERVLRAFRVGESEVAAQLFDSRDRLAVRQNGLALDIDSPNADLDRAWAALESAYKKVMPSDPRTVTVGFQHLAPVSVSFDDAVASGYAGVLGKLGTPGVQFGDWALLIDVKLPEANADGQVEFGIVTRNEAQQRLTGEIAGSSLLEQQHPMVAADANELPEVALYVKSWFRASPGSREAFLSRARAFWEHASQEADGAVAALHAKLGTADTKEQSTG